MKIVLALLLLLGSVFGQEARPQNDYWGYGPPTPQQAAKVGSRFTDIVGLNLYVCTAEHLTPTSSTCTWTLIGPSASTSTAIHASDYPGTAWTDKVVNAYSATVCSSGCTIIVDDSIAGDGHFTTATIPSNVTIVFTGSATFTFCTLNVGPASKVYNYDALLVESGSGCLGINRTAAISMQSTDKFVMDGVRIDCNNQTNSTGTFLGAASAQDFLKNVTIANCTTVGLNLQGVQFGEFLNVNTWGNLVGVKIYSIVTNGGGSSNTFYDLKSTANTVGVLIANPPAVFPLGAIVFHNSNLQANTVSGMAIFGGPTAGTLSSIVTWYGGAPEHDATGAATVTIDGMVIKKSGVYTNNAILQLNDVVNSEGTASPWLIAENGSNIFIKNMCCYGATANFVVQTDATSTTSLSGHIETLGYFQNVTHYPDSVANITEIAMYGSPVTSLNSSIPNSYYGSPLTPAFADINGSSSQAVAIDPVYGPVNTVTHAASAGSNTTNRVNFGSLIGTATGVTTDDVVTLLMKSSVDCSYQLFGNAGFSIGMSPITLKAGQWTAVRMVGTKIASGTAITLTGFPNDSSGPTISYTRLQVYAGATGTAQTQGIIGQILAGAVNPNVTSNFLKPVSTFADFTTDGTTTFQTIGGLSAQPLQWSLPNLGYATYIRFTCDLSYLQLVGNDTVSFGIQAATANPTNIFGVGQMQISSGSPDTFKAGTLATLSTTTATAIVAGVPGATGGQFTVHLAGTIENPAATANIFNIMVKTATGADTVTVRRGSTCAPSN